MPRLRRLRPGPLGLALAAWDVWRRLPPRQRAQLTRLARKHGPTIAKKVVQSRARRRRF